MTAPNVRSRLLIAALLLWVVFLFHETTVRSWDLYRRLPIVDVPGHFLAGMATTALLYWILKRRRTRSPHRTAIIVAFLLALLWEATERLQEVVSPDPRWLRDVFWWDGFFDVVAAVVGSLVVFPLLRWLSGRLAIFRPMDV
jgi:uncharacterized membrane protein YjdF